VRWKFDYVVDHKQFGRIFAVPNAITSILLSCGRQGIDGAPFSRG
jgi:hypothetical protein